MELRDFVRETLTQIMDGVKSAQELQDGHGGEVNPSLWNRGSSIGVESVIEENKGMVSESRRMIEFVQFDIAVVATEGTGTKGGIGVFVGAVGLGSQGESRHSSESQSRIQFRVPI